jgi:hypothetical protein
VSICAPPRGPSPPDYRSPGGPPPDDPRSLCPAAALRAVYLFLSFCPHLEYTTFTLSFLLPHPLFSFSVFHCTRLPALSYTHIPRLADLSIRRSSRSLLCRSRRGSALDRTCHRLARQRVDYRRVPLVHVWPRSTTESECVASPTTGTTAASTSMAGIPARTTGWTSAASAQRTSNATVHVALPIAHVCASSIWRIHAITVPALWAVPPRWL